MSKHTPGPWVASTPYHAGPTRELAMLTFTITHPWSTPGNPHGESLVGHLRTGASYRHDEDVQQADVEFLLRACNAHEGLVAALELAIEQLDRCGEGSCGQTAEALRAILAKAKGG